MNQKKMSFHCFPRKKVLTDNNIIILWKKYCNTTTYKILKFLKRPSLFK